MKTQKTDKHKGKRECLIVQMSFTLSKDGFFA